MAAIDNLESAVTRLTASVDAAIDRLDDECPPFPDEARLQAAADSVNAQSDRLDAAVQS